MASLSRHHGGWLIQYISDNKRKSFYPGVMPKRDAMAVKRHIENLISAKRQRTAVCDETAVWLANQDISIREKLYSHGLIEKPQEHDMKVTIGPFLDAYIRSRHDVKGSTKKVWERCRNHLIRFFGDGRVLSSIGTGEAKDFRQDLLRAGLSENTVRKMCAIASQFFADAVEREQLSKNPFAQKSIPRTTRENRSRDYFITREMADRILEACPDAQWRLLFALSRYGGLRCPSEHLALKWGDILWDQNRIIVTSPKTAHHEGKEQRVIPLFPELRPVLEEVYNEAEPGSEHVITRYRKAETNLRTQLHRIIRAAGLSPWPKLFHNLRATRETELAETYPVHVVCSWVGNNPAVAAKHYLQVTAEHYERATDAMHIAMQHVTEKSGTEGNEEMGDSGKAAIFPHNSLRFRSVPNEGMVTTGLEPATFCV